MDLGVHTSQPMKELMTLNKDQNNSIKWNVILSMM